MTGRAVPEAWIASTWATAERALLEAQREFREDPTPERVQRVRELLLVATTRAQDVAAMVSMLKEGVGR